MSKSTMKNGNDSVLGPLLEAVGQAGYQVRDLGSQARNVAVEAARDYTRRALDLAGERTEPLAEIVRNAIGGRLGAGDAARGAREILDSVRGRIEASRKQLAPWESRAREGLQALRSRLELAGSDEVSELRRRVEALEKKLGESRRAA